MTLTPHPLAGSTPSSETPDASDASLAGDSLLSARATRWYVAALCLLGAIRIFLGAAGLPLFNDVDEQRHFDLVHKVARGCWPDKSRPTVDEETARIDVLYGSVEFLDPPDRFPGGVYPPPVWTIPPSAMRNVAVERATTKFQRDINHEAHSPPFYYTVAAVWYNLGRAAGLNSLHAAYWVRFLNVPLYVGLIVAGWGFCRVYFSSTVALAVPAMIAFFPSTVFFGINNDVLSPLMMLLALWLLLRWHAKSTSVRLSVAAGLAVSATVLVKLTNVAILAVCAVAVAASLRRDWKAGRFKRACPTASLLLLSAIGPLAGWMLRNWLVLGDWMGAGEKVRHLGWRAKPLGQLLDHPLFSLAGQEAFWGRLCTSFYIGDMNWHGSRAMNCFPSDVFFWLSFAVLPLGLGAIWIGNRREGEDRSRLAGTLSALAIAGSVLFLAALSLKYDFGACSFPSRQYPYLNSGRLLYGSLAPVLVLYVCGVVAVTGRARLATWIVLATSILLMATPEIVLLGQVLPNQDNWFHIVIP